jgi:hypothetical protein
LGRPRVTLTVALVAYGPALLACGPPPHADGVGETARAADIHRAKCGSCHVPVEPGTRSREELTQALARHKKRVNLSDAEWASMIEYLTGGAQGEVPPRR